MVQIERVFVTWAPTNAASCKGCNSKFSKGECKVALCSPSPWHSGLDNNFYHLRCCQAQLLKFAEQRQHAPPDFYYKLSSSELTSLYQAAPNMLPQVDPAAIGQRTVLDEALWRLKFGLQELSPKALKEMLELNQRYFDDSFKSPKLAHHCAQGVMFGATPPCPACSQRALIVCPFLNEVHCEGNVDGFARCEYKAALSTVERSSWSVPKSCNGSKSPIPGFVHPEPSQGRELIQTAASKKPAKPAKPANPASQADSKKPKQQAPVAVDSTHQDSAPAVGCELDGCTFFFSGNFSGDRPRLMQMINSAAGGVCSKASKATHILVPAAAASKPGPSAALAKAMNARKDIPVVDHRFVEGLVQSRTLTLREPASLERSGLLLFGSKPGGPLQLSGQPTLAEEPEECAEPEPDGRASKRRKLSSASARLVPDSEGPGGNIVVTDDGCDCFSVMLNMFTPTDNKYYLLQLSQCGRRGGQYVLFMKWGAVGTSALDTHCNTYGAKADAIKAFEAKFKDKTGNKWANKQSFVKKPGKYALVDQADGDESEPEPSEPTASEQQPTPNPAEEPELTKPVQKLIRTIFDAKAVAAAFQGMQLDASRMPLGKLSRRTILQAYSVLKTMLELVGENQLPPEVVESRLKPATAQFFTLIPHMHAPAVIRDEQELKAKVGMLDDLLGLEASQRLISERSGVGCSVWSQYQSLGLDIQPLDSSSPEAGAIEKYVKSSHGATHQQYMLQITALYKLDQPEMSQRFEKVSGRIPNRQLLWHGSRLGNWVGILSQGLRIAPPEAPVTGYMFGKGVYFANSVSKSANYCRYEEHRENPIGLLLLCEVALGNTHELTRANTAIVKPPDGYHSVKGCGQMRLPNKTQMADGVSVPLGPIVKDQTFQTSLIYDEFIIYNEGQQRPRYLVEVKFVEPFSLSDSDSD